MKEENQHNISEELMFRYFSGDVTPEEISVIENWSALSFENQKLLDDTGIFYTDLKALSYLKNNEKIFSTDDAWEKVKFKNNIYKNNDSKVIKLPVSSLKYAAGLAMLLVGIWIFFKPNESHEHIISLASKNQVIEKTLPEGSKITLNKNSSITYSEPSDNNQRNVALTGEAYFEVQSNPERPFVISTQKTFIKVIGTSFNVSSASSSDSIIVTVDSGKVLFSANEQQVELTPGFNGIFIKSQGKLRSTSLPKTSTFDFWRTKTLTFGGVSLSEAIEAIEKSYKTSIKLSDPNLKACKISVEFQGETLENILDVIGTTLNLEVTEENGQHTLIGNGCN